MKRDRKQDRKRAAGLPKGPAVSRYLLLKLILLAALLTAGAAGLAALPRVPRGMVGQQMVTNGLLLSLLLVRLARLALTEINSWKRGRESGPAAPQPAALPAEEPPVSRGEGGQPPTREDPFASTAEEAWQALQTSFADVPAPTPAAPAVRQILGYAEVTNKGMLGIGQQPRLRLTERRSSFTVCHAGGVCSLEPSAHWLEIGCTRDDLRGEQFAALFDMPEADWGRQYAILLRQPAALREEGKGDFVLTAKGALDLQAR